MEGQSLQQNPQKLEYTLVSQIRSYQKPQPTNKPKTIGPRAANIVCNIMVLNLYLY